MEISAQSLKDLPGLDATNRSKLAELGVTTTQQLYQLKQVPKRQQALADRIQVPLRYVQKWVVLSDLARIPSVGCEFNGLLLHVGITSPAQLASSSVTRLYPQIRRLHTQVLGTSSLCPSQDRVLQWIQEARALRPAT